MEKISKKNKVLGLKSFMILLSMVFYCNYNTYAVEENQKNEENQKTEIEDFINHYQERLREGWCSCCMDIDLSNEEKIFFHRIKDKCLNLKKNEEQVKEAEEKKDNAEDMAKEYKKKATLLEELANKNNVSRENKELLNFHINCNNDVRYEIDLAFKEKNYIYREMIANNTLGKDNIEIFVPFIFNERKNEDIFSKVIKSMEEKVDCGPYSFANLKDLLKSALLYLKDTSWRNSRIVTVDFLKLLYFYLYAFNWDEDEKMSKNSSYLDKEWKIQEDLPIEINPCVFYCKNVEIQGEAKDICVPQTFNRFKSLLRLDFSKLIGNCFSRKLIGLLPIEDWKKRIIYSTRGEYYGNEYLIYYLKLDLDNPDCIALLEHVGKGNYGVVKKGLIKTNYGYEPVAIKFTCINWKYENAKKENIENEILAGAVLKLTGITDVASVEKFITIYNLIKHPEKIDDKKMMTVNLGDEIWKIKEDYRERSSWGLNDAMDEFLNEENDRLPEDKKNVKEAFENNVFNKNRLSEDYDSLYIMFMKYVNGEDLFYDNKEVNLDYLGKKLFYFLCKGEQYNISFNDIKPKNIMKGEKSSEFTLIDLQTLSKKNSDLSDTLGTPEYWPFFKTLNFRFYEFFLNDFTGIERLYNDSINSNFVDIYAACMTMYFTKFHTFTAAGLLTLLLKWMVLENENNGKDGWEKVPLEDKINFLKNYDKNYSNYIFWKNYEKGHLNYISLKNKETKSKNKTVFFFENIDDRNLNKDQKRILKNYLLKVLTIKNNGIFISDVDDFFKKFCQYDPCDDGGKKISVNKDELKKILFFFKERVFTDFKNFKLLEDCSYKDIIKYVLCFGSFLDYNNVRNKNMLSPQNDINNNKNEIIENIYNIDNDENEENINDDFNLDLYLNKLELKEDIKDKGTDFFKPKQDFNYNKDIDEIVNILKNSFDQTFMKKLLEILDYEIWNKLKVLSVKKEIIEYHLFQYFNKNQKIFNKKYKEKMLKVFYLMKVLDKKNLLIFPCDIKKLLMFVKDNKNKNLDESDEEI